MLLVTLSAALTGAATRPEATVTLQALDHKPAHRSFRLTRPGAPVELAVASNIRPSIVLPDREARALLAAAERDDVSAGGTYSAGPAGVQVWSGPWDGLLGSKGSARHLGSVDWSYDTPSKHYITVYRVMVTTAGAQAGLSPTDLLARVLGLAGVTAPSDSLQLASPPARDPFRSQAQRGAA